MPSSYIPSEEFIVNTYRVGTQDDSQVSALADGGFVIVWESINQDGSMFGVYAQRYNADGSLNGLEFQVNSYTDYDQNNPAVAAFSDGGFIVTWQSTWQDGQGAGVFAQRYNADGTTNGGEFQVNSFTVLDQLNSSVTVLNDDGFVVTWQGHDGAWSVFAQRYNADGTPDGGEFRVNSFIGSQGQPSMASLFDGGFVVTWDSVGQDGSNTGVFAQRYYADGTTNGGEFQVNSYISDSQHSSAVTALPDGGFVVTWESIAHQDGSGTGIYGQRYNADGTTNGDEFQVNSFIAGDQSQSSVTAFADGSFVVTWHSPQDGDGFGVYAQRYNADGTPDGDEFIINSTIDGNQVFPSVAALADGSFVVSWGSGSSSSFLQQDGSGNGIIARIFTPISGDDTFIGTAAIENFDGGAGIDTVDYSNGAAVNIDLQNGVVSGGFAAGDSLTSIENIIGSDDAAERDWIWGDALDNHIEGMAGHDILEGGAGADIIDGGEGWDYSRYTRSSEGVTVNLETGVNTGGDAQGDVLIDIEAVVGSAHNDFLTGGSSKDYLRGENGDDILDGGLGNDQLFGGNGDDTYLYGAGIDTIHETGSGLERVVFDASIDPLSVVISDNKFTFNAGVDELKFNDISLIESFAFDGYADMTLAELLALQNGGGSSDILVEGSEFQVNTYEANNQHNPMVTSLLDGGFVVTWQSWLQDGSNYGVYGQRYNADGTSNGAEFQVNTFTNDDQEFPSIASLSDGGFVVTWESDFQDGNGSNASIYGQRYHADGTTNGGEFLINTNIVGWQQEPSVTSLSDGGFVVTWNSLWQDGSSSGIYGQRYNADGTTHGTEFQVNSETSDNQWVSSVTSLSDGGFVVTWQSQFQDGSDYGIFGQRYNADGTVNGTEFQVNTYTDSWQRFPSVASLLDGGFVVTWESDGQDGSGAGIYGQRYNADGTTHGTEFQVNSYTDLWQASPSVTSLPNGGFVVTWHSQGQEGVSIYDGVYGQRYNADGTTDGVEFQINTYEDFDQAYPSVTALPDGSFVTVWQSDTQDGSGNGVFAKIFTLEPLSGDNIFIGTADVQAFDGGAGIDTVDYADSLDAVKIDLLAGTGSAGDAAGDTFISIENIIGTDVASERDWIWGDAADNHIQGLAGADILEGGAGADIIDGGAGWDYSRYLRSDAGININLETGVNTGGDAQGDVLIDIEAIVGSNYNDVIRGGTANDYLKGEGGDDIIAGGAGADQLYGGDGADVFLFEAITAFDRSDNIRDFDILENDAIDISDILVDYNAATDAISEFVQITDDGVNSILSVDANGGADNFVQIATIYGVTGLTDEDALETAGNLIAV